MVAGAVFAHGSHCASYNVGGGRWLDDLIIQWVEAVEQAPRDEADGDDPKHPDGVHLMLSGLRGRSWQTQCSRLGRLSAMTTAGQVHAEASDFTKEAEPSTDSLTEEGASDGSSTTPPRQLATQVPIHPLELDFISGPRTGERLTLSERRCTMGRGEQATIQVSDPALSNVSRVHCIFEYVGNRWHIRDNGSTNGTWRRLSCILEPSKPMPLEPGMSILAGVHEFRVEEAEIDRYWLPSAAQAVLEGLGDRQQLPLQPL